MARTPKPKRLWTSHTIPNYISAAERKELNALNREVGSMLGSMIKAPGKFLPNHAPDA